MYETRWRERRGAGAHLIMARHPTNQAAERGAVAAYSGGSEKNDLEEWTKRLTASSRHLFFLPSVSSAPNGPRAPTGCVLERMELWRWTDYPFFYNWSAA